ncbi:MAG TPA: EAL domain-containing protein, partial [Candidatus Dormibacteraeota bacterium]|nr:EAL domain-containing protein [Candidatus Dormibacteraeota bacterium]
REALAATGYDPTLLTLEITETALMRDITSVRGRLLELHSMGIHLALDDFGTGYSSLTYLRQFPIDVLKIDRSFVAGVASDQHDASVTRAIVQLGKSLELSTVAEGVERPEQVYELLRLHCEYGQGYYFARPMSAGDMSEYLRPLATTTVRSAEHAGRNARRIVLAG